MNISTYRWCCGIEQGKGCPMAGGGELKTVIGQPACSGNRSSAAEAECRAGALRYMDTMVKQWNPNLSYRLREFRSSADGHCIEEVVVG